VNFVGQGYQKLEDHRETDRQTDRQTHNITTHYSRAIIDQLPNLLMSIFVTPLEYVI